MLLNGIKQLVIPPGGWFYEQPIDNSSPFRIEGQTYPLLETKVFDFRLANVEIIPSGTATRESVADDLRIYLCSKFPNQCGGNWQQVATVVASPEVSHVSGYSTPISRLDDWFKKLSHSNIEWKDVASAMDAAKTCVACPQNVGWQTGCKPCVESVQRRIVRYKGDKSTALDAKLLSCRCFGHNNELAIWMKDPYSTAKETPPKECWNAR